ncbi:MAG: formate/nitrite transporter family protein [Rhodospirillales bacterium]|jgi:formate/nitrite transporter|nr:formate transporter FocA [Rhodospirillaceae bacterium]MDP6427736.1 formate/nitrite transporter family protein [Rhodospirillales bacterium]MDP6643379.1 formate/nitrite transporter family protein [Rhodospirillales bacterium]MDP6840627.1 formate/nitrite transporter family protein [Rhodospirillales bacterium]|tara:strand:+ start:2484 stop:3293 length:810 start_codon:yes stop_codon:yes gene_type:complete
MNQFNPTPNHYSIDAYAPSEIARRVETAGLAKVELAVMPTLALAVLAGAFIAFGAMYFTLVMTGHGLGFGPSRALGGVAFSLGLILVLVAGAELFTGNNLIVMAWADKKTTTAKLLRNWVLVYIGNFIGSAATAVIVVWSGVLGAGDGAVGATAMKIAEAKVALPFAEAFFRGILCNALVCLAVWLCFATHTVSGKILAIIFPISAFVALGFEHSVANMYLIPVGYLAGADGVTIVGFIGNLVPVTLGNIVGGSAFVAFVYWIIYLRNK